MKKTRELSVDLGDREDGKYWNSGSGAQWVSPSAYCRVHPESTYFYQGMVYI